MRSRLAALMLFAVLPVLNVLAAPGPDPSAILDIGPPPKGETAEHYRKRQIEGQTCHFMLCRWWSEPEVKKLPSVAAMKDARPWLAENLRITEEKGERLLRLTFRAGTRAEQATIINALLRANLALEERSIKVGEEWLRRHENHILDLEKRIRSSQNPQEAATYQNGIDYLRSIDIPKRRAALARRKQFVVIRWAK